MSQSLAVSVDEFLSKRQMSSNDGVMYRAAKMPKSFDPDLRSARFVMTDETVDSYGDIVKANGADLDRFMNNPICLLNHRSDRVIGTWSDVKQVKKSLEGTVTLAVAETSEHVDEAFALMSQGILKAASIGFMPLKVERRLDENGEPMWSYIIHEYELYECSVVSIPANPAALAKSIKEGHGMARDLLEQVLDEYVKTPAGLIIPRAEFEAAHKEANGNSFSVLSAKIDELAAKVDAITTKSVDEPADPAQAPDETVEVDEIKKAAEASVDQAIADLEPRIEVIKSDDHKTGIRALFDSIKALFKTTGTDEPKPEITEIPEVTMTPEQRAAILQRATKFAPAN